MRDTLAICFLLLSFCFSLSLAADDLWLHVRVHDGEEKVSVNLPFNLIETVLQSVKTSEFDRGVIQIEDMDVDRELLVAIVDAAKKSKDGVFVSIESEGENVQVSKKGDEMHVLIDGEDEQVTARIPIEVAEALLTGDENELNLLAGLAKLAEQGDATLVTVEGKEEQIRVWIDRSMEGI